MNNNKFKLNLVTATLLSLLATACSEETDQTANISDDIPEPLAFVKSGEYQTVISAPAGSNKLNGLSLELIDEATLEARLQEEREKPEYAELSADELETIINEFEATIRTSAIYDGTATTYKLLPTEATRKVTGIESLAHHQFSLALNGAAPNVPHPDRCPGDADFLVPEDPTTAKPDGQTAPITQFYSYGADVDTVVLGDEVDMRFNIPAYRYGITYAATLNYGDKQYDFSVSTPEEVKLPNDLEFISNGDGQLLARVQDRFSTDVVKGLDFTESLFNFTGGNVEHQMLTTPVADTDGNIIPVKAGKVYTFLTSAPVTGMSAFSRNSFNFTVEDHDRTYVETGYRVINEGKPSEQIFEEYSIEQSVVQVRSISTDKITQTYSGGCAAQGDVIAVSFHLPADSYDKTFSATLTWPSYELVQKLDDNGDVELDDELNPVMVSQLKQEEITFNVQTAVEDSEPTKLDTDTVFTKRSTNVPADGFVYYEIDLKDFNNALAVFNVENTEYSIDGAPYTSGVASIAPGQSLIIRVQAANTGSKSHTVRIAGVDYQWDTIVAAGASVEAFTAAINYPPAVSATLSDSVTLRGHAYFAKEVDGKMVTSTTSVDLEENITITASDILIEGTALNAEGLTEGIDYTFDAQTGIWTRTLSLVEAGDYNFTLTSADTITDTVSIRKLASDATMPSDMTTDYKGFDDISFDQRNNVFYATSVGSSQLVKFPLVSTLTEPGDETGRELLTIENKHDKSKSYSDNYMVQINNNDPIDRRYIFKSGRNKLSTSLLEPGILTEKISSNNYLDVTKGIPDETSHAVFDDEGKVIYVTGKAKLSQVTPNYSDLYDVNDGGVQIPFISTEGFYNVQGVVVSSQFDSQSVDIFTLNSGEFSGQQIIIALSKVRWKNDGDNTLWFIPKKPTYIADSSATPITLVVMNGDTEEALQLDKATSVAVDDNRQTAYVVNGDNTLYAIDLSALAGLFENAIPQASSDPVKLVAKQLSLMSTPDGAITSLIMEGGLPYLVATDKESSVYAIDQVTGEVVYLIKTK
ncbi:hypothetical protein [Colwellia piezophila]|uniref:hypothetical protein n=1 Tax=Colwellia piezophila TaxID=211668 RepID=UPI00035C74A2|nr:hypothetical protein [Colwellia piezophila]